MSVPGGESIGEEGSFLYGTLGGWFRHRASGRAALLTAAHLLRAPAIRRPYAPPPPRAASGELWDLDGESVWLGRVDPPARVGRVRRAGVTDRARQPASLDACFAEAVDETLATRAVLSLPWVPSIGEAAVGRRVVKITRGSGLREGRVIAVDWPSGRYGSQRDLLIESADGRRFGVDGDSGALVIDPEARAIVGLHIGDAQDVTHGGALHAVAWCAHPIAHVLELLGLDPLD